jgi:hypothetical protein
MAGTQRTGFTARSADSAWAATPVDLDLGPQDADAAEQQAQVGRLEQHGRVGQDARPAGRQGAVAGALLLDDGQEPQLAAQGAGAARRSAATASRPMAKPPFMSPAPRPVSQPPRGPA